MKIIFLLALLAISLSMKHSEQEKPLNPQLHQIHEKETRGNPILLNKASKEYNLLGQMGLDHYSKSQKPQNNAPTANNILSQIGLDHYSQVQGSLNSQPKDNNILSQIGLDHYSQAQGSLNSQPKENSILSQIGLDHYSKSQSSPNNKGSNDSNILSQLGLDHYSSKSNKENSVYKYMSPSVPDMVSMAKMSKSSDDDLSKLVAENKDLNVDEVSLELSPEEKEPATAFMKDIQAIIDKHETKDAEVKPLVDKLEKGEDVTGSDDALLRKTLLALDAVGRVLILEANENFRFAKPIEEKIKGEKLRRNHKLAMAGKKMKPRFRK